MNNRRYKRITCSPEFLASAMHDGDHSYRIVRDGVPLDAKVIGCGHDNLSNTIYVFIEHESFDEVPEGEIIPALYPLFQITSQEEFYKMSSVRIISSDEVKQ